MTKRTIAMVVTGCLLVLVLITLVSDVEVFHTSGRMRREVIQAPPSKTRGFEWKMAPMSNPTKTARMEPVEAAPNEITRPPSDMRRFFKQTFLNVVKPNIGLPECKSGNEFLSFEGGRWERDPTYIKNKTIFMDNNTADGVKSRPSCYSDDYKDEYIWSANCSFPLPKRSEVNPIRVILLGDSLSRQIVRVSQFMNLEPLDLNLLVWHNPMLKTVPFKSAVCESCKDFMDENPINFRVKFLDEDEFLDPFLECDFLFYNEYAHFVGFFLKNMMDHYKGKIAVGQNVSTRPLTDDILDWFKRQMERKAELLQKIKAKVYYRTVPPQATDGVVVKEGEAKAGIPLKKPAREVPLEECYDYEAGWGALCYSVVNQIAMTAFQSKGHSILDTVPAMSQRADAHPCWSKKFKSGDCLHFCQPGPPSAMLAAVVVEVFAREKAVENVAY